MAISSRRKAVAALATMLAAGAVAVGSGATFTTQTHNTVSGVTAGNLKQTNSKADKAVLNLANIKPGDSVTGSVTITNTGSIGALFDTPILNAPQVAILGTGAIVKRPVVLTDAEGQETIAIRSMMYLALSYDHQVVDGADAARYLQTVKKRIEAGEFEGDLGL